MEDDNIQMQKDEIEALSSIYEEDFHTENKSTSTYSIDIKEGETSAVLQVTFTPGYPNSAPPIYMLSAPWLEGVMRQELCGLLEEIYLSNIGECIVYLWVEKIREFIVDKCSGKIEEVPQKIEENASQQKTIIHECELEKVKCPTISSGEIIIDRKSHFQGHCAIVASLQEIKKVLQVLYENKKIANATHNIYAYRILLENSVICQEFEDDGETHAGTRLLHLLQILDVKNVLVVVSRWYGGILLGPDRFKHINNAARQILKSSGFITANEDSKKKNRKNRNN